MPSATEIPELPRCITDGSSYQEALSNAEQIIEEWIDTASKSGRSIPQPKGDSSTPRRLKSGFLCWARLLQAIRHTSNDVHATIPRRGRITFHI
ncbi:type II toxin-antitoxin system HicB family antitoxin [Candidatus Bipolaricaulota bacterium]|nr:type II toxin-antitoxin system HicB family antitoxin [Candidatus Bipolaricaulota bacterium]